MSDVAFLLVIFFLVTSTFALSRGLPVTLPPPSDEPGGDGAPSILLHVRADGAAIDCMPAPPGALADALERRIREVPGRTVVVHTDADAPYARMVEAYDALRTAVERTGIRAIDGVAVPTRADLEAWRKAFGRDPIAAWCDPGR
jgi:biopolymer transport protein ExbD